MAKLEASEKVVKSVSMRMTTEGRHPAGQQFRSEGSLRVLRGTHFHVTMKFRFSEEHEGESETVRTPNGVWIRDKGPAFGEVFLQIPGPTGEPDGTTLLEQLDEAALLLGDDASVLGTFDSRSMSPLGSRMLRDLDQRYKLEVQKKASLGRDRGYRVVGDLRAQPEGPLTPDRVELFIREIDGAVLEMVQFREGAPMTRVRIEDLRVGEPMDPSTFTIDPKGRAFRSIREHPPAWTAIERLLEQARSVRNRGCYRLGFVPRDEVEGVVIQTVDKDLRKDPERGERLFAEDRVLSVGGKEVAAIVDVNQHLEGVASGSTVSVKVRRTVEVPVGPEEVREEVVEVSIELVVRDE